MAMTRYTDEPGSPAWHARRARCFNAGDAAALLGCHPSGVTRTELMTCLKTGVEREFSNYVQEKVINPGHRVEALWRPIAEEILGEDLQVLAGSLDIGLSRPLGTSLDGITFMEDRLGECKSANDALREALPYTGRDSHAHNNASRLPKGYRVQMEQQQLVTGATLTLFSACSFNADGSVAEERHCWYSSDPELRAEIVAAWRVADAELPTFVPPAPSAVEKIVAEPVEALPAPVIQVTGQLALQDNFKVFEERLRHFLEHRLIREPKSDQDFADLDQQIKAMKQAREALKAAEQQMLAQVEPVDQAKKTKDMLDKLLQQNVSLSEKILKDEKERRKGEIVAVGVKSLADHIAGLNQRLGKPYMPAVPADFGGVIRGLKSLASMEDKVATELARAKAQADRIALGIQQNLGTLRELAADFVFLFADTAQLVLKAPDDCRAQIEARIAAHKAEQQRRAEELAERERARIRAEEVARVEREAQERAAAERRQREEQEVLERRQREEEAARAELQRQEQEALETEQRRQEAAAKPLAAIATPSPVAGPAVIPMPTRAPAAPAGPPTLRLGEIQKRLAPVSIDAAGLAELGFPFAKQEGASKLWAEASFEQICDAIIAQVARAKLRQKEAA